MASVSRVRPLSRTCVKRTRRIPWSSRRPCRRSWSGRTTWWNWWLWCLGHLGHESWASQAWEFMIQNDPDAGSKVVFVHDETWWNNNTLRQPWSWTLNPAIVHHPGNAETAETSSSGELWWLLQQVFGQFLVPRLQLSMSDLCGMNWWRFSWFFADALWRANLSKFQKKSKGLDLLWFAIAVSLSSVACSWVWSSTNSFDIGPLSTWECTESDTHALFSTAQ